MTENNAADWILINLKFRGKCIVCGKEIKSGRALWSRTTKSIKHLDCSVSNTSQSSESEGAISREQKTTSQKRYKKAIVPTCFICGKPQPEGDEYDVDEYPYLKQVKSPSYICKSCLQREDAFDAYREAFLQKIKRYLK
jgi:predicted nucleic acid-binding Zn ribbon protein